MAKSKHKNTSRVVLDLGDGRMVAPGEFADVDPEAAAVADHVASGRLKATGKPKSKTARGTSEGES